jgi:hypothetical protein
MLPVGFEPAIPAIEWPQTYVLQSAGTGIGSSCNCVRTKYLCTKFNSFEPNFSTKMLSDGRKKLVIVLVNEKATEL